MFIFILILIQINIL